MKYNIIFIRESTRHQILILNPSGRFWAIVVNYISR